MYNAILQLPSERLRDVCLEQAPRRDQLELSSDVPFDNTPYPENHGVISERWNIRYLQVCACSSLNRLRAGS